MTLERGLYINVWTDVIEFIISGVPLFSVPFMTLVNFEHHIAFNLRRRFNDKFTTFLEASRTFYGNTLIKQL